jgi:hypothetical protein
MSAINGAVVLLYRFSKVYDGKATLFFVILEVVMLALRGLGAPD